MTTNRKRSLKTVSEFIDLVLFQLICQLLANLFGVKSERTEFEFRKRKKKTVCGVHLVYKADT